MDWINHAEHLEYTKRCMLAQNCKYITALTAGVVDPESFRFIRECAQYVVRAAADRVKVVFPDEKYDIGIRFAVWEKDQTQELIVQIIDEAIQLARLEAEK